MSISNKFLKRPIAFHRMFVDVAGGILPGLMLSQAFYWSDKTGDNEGWFWKTSAEWEKETGMKKWEQSTARKKLRSVTFNGKNLWHEELRGLPAKLWFFVDTDLLDEILESSLQQEVTNRSNKGKRIAPTSSDESPNHSIYTKTTSQTTSQTTHEPVLTNPWDTEDDELKDAILKLLNSKYATWSSQYGKTSEMILDEHVQVAKLHGWDAYVRAFNAATTSGWATGAKAEHVDRLANAKSKVTMDETIKGLKDGSIQLTEEEEASMAWLKEAMTE